MLGRTQCVIQSVRLHFAPLRGMKRNWEGLKGNWEGCLGELNVIVWNPPWGGGFFQTGVRRRKYKLGSTKQRRWFPFVFRACSGRNSWYKLQPKTRKPTCPKKDVNQFVPAISSLLRWAEFIFPPPHPRLKESPPQGANSHYQIYSFEGNREGWEVIPPVVSRDTTTRDGRWYLGELSCISKSNGQLFIFNLCAFWAHRPHLCLDSLVQFC